MAVVHCEPWWSCSACGEWMAWGQGIEGSTSGGLYCCTVVSSESWAALGAGFWSPEVLVSPAPGQPRHGRAAPEPWRLYATTASQKTRRGSKGTLPVIWWKNPKPEMFPLNILGLTSQHFLSTRVRLARVWAAILQIWVTASSLVLHLPLSGTVAS